RRAVEQRRHGERARGRAGEESRGEDSGAGIDEGHHLALAPPREPSVGGHRKIAASAIADAGRRGCEQQQRIHALGIEGIGRAGLGLTQSIKMVSELTWKNGPSPSLGSALTTPPPVPRSSLRSSEMTISGRLRPARWRSIWSARWCTFTTARSTPCAARRSST